MMRAWAREQRQLVNGNAIVGVTPSFQIERSTREGGAEAEGPRFARALASEPLLAQAIAKS